MVKPLMLTSPTVFGRKGRSVKVDLDGVGQEQEAAWCSCLRGGLRPGQGQKGILRQALQQKCLGLGQGTRLSAPVLSFRGLHNRL